MGKEGRGKRWQEEAGKGSKELKPQQKHQQPERNKKRKQRQPALCPFSLVVVFSFLFGLFAHTSIACLRKVLIRRRRLLPPFFFLFLFPVFPPPSTRPGPQHKAVSPGQAE